MVYFGFSLHSLVYMYMYMCNTFLVFINNHCLIICKPYKRPTVCLGVSKSTVLAIEYYHSTKFLLALIVTLVLSQNSNTVSHTS